MTISGTVTINSKEYHVIWSEDGYKRAMNMPRTIRRSVTGKILVSVGAGSPGEVIVMVLLVPWVNSASSNEGTLSDIEALLSETSVSMTDHVSSTEWGSGTFDVTVMGTPEVVNLGPHPSAGYLVQLQLRKVLS